MGLYRSNGIWCTQCEAEGFRRITYFLDRPDVLAPYRVRIEADRNGSAGPAGERQPRRDRRASGRPALRRLGRPVQQAVLPVRHGGGRPRFHARGLPDDERPDRPARHLHREGPRRAGDLRHGRPEAIDGLGRAALRPRIRPRRLQHRRHRRLQHGGDGEQGPQRLQPQIRPARLRHGDGRGLCRRRDGDCPRVLPQLDGQPHHLPRLVPALPEGRPDGLPRPGVLRRRALGAGAADRRGAQAEGAPVPRGPGSAAASGAADANTTRSTTSIPRPSTTRAPSSCG